MIKYLPSLNAPKSKLHKSGALILNSISNNTVQVKPTVFKMVLLVSALNKIITHHAWCKIYDCIITLFFEYLQ